MYIYIYVYILGGGVLGPSHSQLQKAPDRAGIILHLASVLKQLCLSHLTDLVEMCIFHGFELPGHRKSDFLTNMIHFGGCSDSGLPKYDFIIVWVDFMFVY